jgi:hypothetical protein
VKSRNPVLLIVQQTALLVDRSALGIVPVVVAAEREITETLLWAGVEQLAPEHGLVAKKVGATVHHGCRRDEMDDELGQLLLRDVRKELANGLGGLGCGLRILWASSRMMHPNLPFKRE